MKFIFLILIALLFVFEIHAQFTELAIVRSAEGKKIDWYISDPSGNIMFDGSYFKDEDTLVFPVLENHRFFIHLSVPELNPKDSVLFVLYHKDQPLYIAMRNTAPGDYSYPFFTGVNHKTLKITGGTDARIEDFPWQVILFAGNSVCGGTIISDKWIITAAHCLKGVGPNNVYVRVGTSNFYSRDEGKNYGAKSVKIHERYDYKTYINDIALVELKSPIDYPNAEKIEMVSEDDALQGIEDPGVLATLTGWGVVKAGNKMAPEILQKVYLPIVSNETASAVWSDTSNTILMAGYKNGTKDACFGDSGGPLVVPFGEDFKLAGIVSWGSSLCNSYGAYTRVSSYENWIKEKTGIKDNYKPGIPNGDLIICQGIETSVFTTSEMINIDEYQWEISPESAGYIINNDFNAIIVWDDVFSGMATVSVRTKVNDTISSWSSKMIVRGQKTAILNQPSRLSTCMGESLSLELEAQGYDLKYDWYLNNKFIQTSYLSKMNFNSLSETNSGQYFVEVQGRCGTVRSDVIELNVYPWTETIQPLSDRSVSFGDYTTLDARYIGQDLVFSWEKDGEKLDNAVVPFVFDSVDAGDIGMYKLIVDGICGSTTDSSYLFVDLNNNMESDQNFSVWPTVTNDLFYVANKYDMPYDIYGYNVRGELLFVRKNLRYNECFSLGEFESGLIIMRIETQTQNEFHRIIRN